jgi:hypothetical protein
VVVVVVVVMTSELSTMSTRSNGRLQRHEQMTGQRGTADLNNEHNVAMADCSDMSR